MKMNDKNCLNYKSTRGRSRELNFKNVIFEGLASDGGLYIPSYWPRLKDDLIHDFKSLSYQEIAFHVFKPYVNDSLPDDKLMDIISQSYESFSHQEITPVNEIEDDEYLLELFHGPTYAFKDIAMQFISRLMDFYLTEDKKNINILGATSGDTGSAAIYGFKAVKSSNLFILHPYNLISPTQRKFMTTVSSDNIINIAVKGNFDDCQNLIKEIFTDESYKQTNNLGAVNSINWARIMCQITYYFYCSSRITNSDRIIFSVPTGNFGDIFAGYIAKKMGLDFRKLIISTNENNILDRALRSGEHSIKNVINTTSPSIDIQISSNFERLLYDSCKNSEYVSQLMMDLKESKSFMLSDEIREYICTYFSSDSANEDEVEAVISDYFNNYGITVDPHTAVGIACGKKQKSSDDILVTLSTAHPAKFKETVSKIISNDSFVTDKVKQLDKLDEHMIITNNSVREIKEIINNKIA